MKRLFFYSFICIVFFACDAIKPKPQADFVFSFISKDNSSATYAFTNKSKNYTETWWYFGDGAGSGSRKESDIHTFFKNGTYDVRLIVRNENGESKITKSVTVTEVPEMGQFSFVTTCNRGPITVMVEGVNVGTITSRYNSVPTSVACGESGNVTITRPQGAYSYTARSSQGKTWSGTIPVLSGVCKAINLNCD